MPIVFRPGFGAAHDLEAELVVLVHRADLLRALVLDELGQGGAHLVVVGRRERVLQAMERLVHLARRGDREEVDHVLLELHRHRRQVLRRADVPGHDEDLVLVDQLLRRQHRLLRVVGGVLDQELELAAVDAALLVDLVDAQHHAEPHLLAEAGDRPREVLDRADHDLVLADALLLGGDRAGGGEAEGGGQCREPCLGHRISLVIVRREVAAAAG